MRSRRVIYSYACKNLNRSLFWRSYGNGYTSTAKKEANSASPLHAAAILKRNQSSLQMRNTAERSHR